MKFTSLFFRCTCCGGSQPICVHFHTRYFVFGVPQRLTHLARQKWRWKCDQRRHPKCHLFLFPIFCSFYLWYLKDVKIAFYTKDRVFQSAVNKSSDAVEWVMTVGESFHPDFNIGFDIGDDFPLSLNVTGGIGLNIQWQLQLGFGFSLMYVSPPLFLFLSLLCKQSPCPLSPFSSLLTLQQWWILFDLA